MVHDEPKMRFLDTSAGSSGTLAFKYVADSEINVSKNRYAILSHRWGAEGDEVTFVDINESKATSHKRGFVKLKRFCEEAFELGCAYGWADTCCINKGDSSELSEAINSMYRWYQRSHICIVYFKDVPEKAMMKSEWFDRGWTLQELIGPRNAYFYDRNWKLIGTKSGLLAEDNHNLELIGMNSELLAELSLKTRIPKDVLSHATSPLTCSVAQKMSWAANRKTERDEDRAYSLLGILGVYMPLIYGEGMKAFLRLQRTIESKDESIFAWEMGIKEDRRTYTGLFAPSPDSYVNCTKVIQTSGSTGFSDANGELSIELRTLPHSMETYYAVLNCTERASTEDRIAILVTRTSTDGEYVRVKKTLTNGKKLLPLSDLKRSEMRPLRIPVEPTEAPLNRIYGFWLRSLEPPGHTSCQTKILSRRTQSQNDFIGLGDEDTGTAGMVYMEPKIKLDCSHDLGEVGWSKIGWIKLGFDTDFNPMVFLANNKRRYLFHESSTSQSKTFGELFEQAVTSEVGSIARNEMLNNLWINKLGSVPSKSHGWETGTAVLRVDRREGISGCLEALNLNISVRLCSAYSPHMTLKESTDESPRQIWVVDITDAGGSDPEQDRAKADKEIEDKEMADECASCCGGRPTYDAVPLKSRRSDARRQRRFLDASDLSELK